MSDRRSQSTFNISAIFPVAHRERPPHSLVCEVFLRNVFCMLPFPTERPTSYLAAGALQRSLFLSLRNQKTTMNRFAAVAFTFLFLGGSSQSQWAVRDGSPSAAVVVVGKDDDDDLGSSGARALQRRLQIKQCNRKCSRKFKNIKPSRFKLCRKSCKLNSCNKQRNSGVAKAPCNKKPCCAKFGYV